MKHFKFLLTLCIVFISCQQQGTFNPDRNIEEVWSRTFYDIGIYSSPRATDLTGDGVKDLIFGTGKLEMMETHVGVVALSGATGEILWSLPARDQVFGSANLLDITGDGVQDVIINGRAAILMAIEGKTGEILWEFLPDVTFQEAKEMGFYNFYNAQFIPDQNGDGLPDLLVANGGDFTIQPYDPDRPPGRLMVISSRTGEMLAEAFVPDGRETYMSAVVNKLNDSDSDFTIIYGTGGETIGGSLYRTTLNELMNGDISNSIELATSMNKGFIAPPVLADLNKDGNLDIVVNAVDGRIIAINGSDNSLLWEYKVDNTEIYSSLAAGKFIDENRTDIFSTLTVGVWPDLRDNLQILIRGDTGEVLSQDTLGVSQTASPVAADFNNDGYDNILLSINVGYEQFDGSLSYDHFLAVYDMKNDHQYMLDKKQPGANLASTPWIGSLKNDGQLDIIYTILVDNKNIYAMNGFKITRLRSSISTEKKVRWGAYMGSNYNGIYEY